MSKKTVWYGNRHIDGIKNISKRRLDETFAGAVTLAGETILRSVRPICRRKNAPPFHCRVYVFQGVCTDPLSTQFQHAAQGKPDFQWREGCRF